MGAVFVKAFSFIAIILLGFGLKKAKVFSAGDFRIVSRIVLTVTLPAAVITSFNQLDLQMSLIFLVPIGLLCNLFTIGIGYFTAYRRDSKEKAFRMLNLSGYNIGCFTLPYVQAFLGPAGVISTCLFDAGNSVMCTGATYSLAATVANTGEKATPGSILKKMVSSVAFDTYLIMLLLAIFHIKLPDPVITFTSAVGNANGFLAMFMIGLGFELHLGGGQFPKILKMVGLRFLCSAALALLFYFCLPFPQEIRQVLAIISFAPVSAIAPAFTEKCGGDVGLASAVNSVSILVSIATITSLLLVMQAGSL